MNTFLRTLFVNFNALMAVLFVIIGCKPESIDIDIAPPAPQLVVASQVIPNQAMVVALTRSFSALDKPAEGDTASQDFLNQILVKNALVTISYNNKTDTLFMFAPGIYVGVNTLYTTGGIYQLTAYDGLEDLTVSATATMLPQVKFDTIFPIVNRTSNDTTVTVDYTFTDPIGESNWYVVNYYSQSKKAGANIDINSYFGFGSNKLIAFELLSDKTFPLSRYHEQFKLNGVRGNDSIAVTISNISEGYYQFLTAYQRSGSLLAQISGEPINYPTNVVNGYGFFNTHYPDVRYFYLKDF